MCAPKEIYHKVRGPTRSENARYLLVWVYCERRVHILYASCAYYTQYLCWFRTAKAPLRQPLHHAMCSLVKTSRKSLSQKVSDAWWGFDCDLRQNERNNEAGISALALSLESPGKTIRFGLRSAPNRGWTGIWVVLHYSDLSGDYWQAWLTIIVR